MKTPEQTIREACIKANPTIKSNLHEGTGNNLRCKNCGDPDLITSWGQCKKGSERPIRLADVLLAIKQISNYDEFFWGDHDMTYVCMYMWNLRNDSLSDQSVETLAFLAELLK